MRILYFLTLFLLLGNISLKAQQNYKIGDIYTFDDNTKGIVFYVDTDGHGLVVSMEQEKEDGKKRVTMFIVRISLIYQTKNYHV